MADLSSMGVRAVPEFNIHGLGVLSILWNILLISDYPLPWINLLLTY